MEQPSKPECKNMAQTWRKKVIFINMLKKQTYLFNLEMKSVMGRLLSWDQQAWREKESDWGKNTFFRFFFFLLRYFWRTTFCKFKVWNILMWYIYIAICLQCGRPGFDSWVGKIPWRRERIPTPVFWPGEFHGLYSTWGRKESDTTERLSLSL